MASITDFLSKLVLPKGKPKKGGTALTSTLSQSGVPTRPNFRDHTLDISTNRLNDDSNTLLKNLFRNDPDVSAAVNAYLTVANTKMHILAYDTAGQLDAQAMQTANNILGAMTTRRDYSTKFRYLQSLQAINSSMRYSLLLGGVIAVELIFDKFLIPADIRFIDGATLRWEEKTSGIYKPKQLVNNNTVSLDLPTVFIQHFRKNPSEIYSYSAFVSAINTIAARQQVINDLYRIMKRVGYPRIEATLVEGAIINSAPVDIRKDPQLLSQYVEAKRSEIEAGLNNLASDTAIVHGDSMTLSILNKDGPKASMDATSIINVLNASNQAALKTMATIIGRGTAGVNTASVESRIFAKNADELNDPVADVWSQMLTLALRMSGSTSYVQVSFKKAELRPDDELEPHLSIRQGRLENALSEGLITDQEFHQMVFGRPKPDSLPDLSGTGFKAGTGNQLNPTSVSQNNGPLNKSLTPKNPNANKSKSNPNGK